MISLNPQQPETLSISISKASHPAVKSKIDEVLGTNKPIPVGSDPAAVKAYYFVLSAIYKMAERMEIKCEAHTVIQNKAFKAMERYKKLNVPDQEFPAGLSG